MARADTHENYNTQNACLLNKLAKVNNPISIRSPKEKPKNKKGTDEPNKGQAVVCLTPYTSFIHFSLFFFTIERTLTFDDPALHHPHPRSPPRSPPRSHHPAVTPSKKHPFL